VSTRQSLDSGRRAASLLVALACACTLLASLLAVNANAAGKVVVAVRPSAHSTGALHLKTPVGGSRVVTGRTPDVSPFGTAVYFQNNYGTTVWVATERYNTGCYGSWENEGWYQLAPGQSEWLFTTTNEYAYFYAEAADGATWTGPYGGSVDPYHAYDFCNTSNTNATDPGMRQIDLGGFNLFQFSYTINLVP
jgi:hypothetical protein